MMTHLDTSPGNSEHRSCWGGFAAVQGPGDDVQVWRERAHESGAETIFLEEVDLLLGAWPEMEGQGLFRQDDCALAYDVDLTNQAELVREADLAEGSADLDVGALLLRLYLHKGIDFVNGLRGQFAFALWDGAHRELWVVTDFYGIRPVVHTGTEYPFSAASRIRHLLLSPAMRPEIDLEAIYQYIYYQAICSPLTVYRGIRKLEPGKMLHWKDRRYAIRTYYDIRYESRSDKPEDFWLEAIPEEVRRAVSRFVPLSDLHRTGCFLSGGTDSSSVAGYVARISGQSPKTFSIAFDDPRYNELDYAHLASRHFGTQQHDYWVTPGDVGMLLDALSRVYDEPFGNASVVPAYYCALSAKKAGVDVLLAGDGGDEIFGGNERYVTNLVFQRYHDVPELLRKRLLEPVLKLLPDRGVFYRAKRYVRRANIPNPDRFYSYNLVHEVGAERIFTSQFLERLQGDPFLEHVRRLYALAHPAHDTDRLLYLDMKLTVTDNDLRKVTHMGEAAGVRVRYPLLDRDLVDFAAAIPPTLKVKPGKNRYIFKKAMASFLPIEIIRKQKHGFGLPITPWFRKDPGLRAVLESRLFDGSPLVCRFVRRSYLEFLKEAFLQEQTDYYGSQLWELLVLENWLRSREGEVVLP